MAEKHGIIMDYTNCGLDIDIDGMRQPKKKGEMPLDTFMMEWHPFVEEMLKKLQPDVVLSDYFSCPGTINANRMKLPLVINVPTSLAYFERLGYDQINMRQTTSCCGMICVKRSCVRSIVGWFVSGITYLELLYE